MATITHTKTNNLADWTQAQLDTVIAGGAVPLPPSGTVLDDVVLPSDWNANHVVSNIVNADISASAAIDASKIADGTVSNTEFQYINNLTSNAQTQIDAKIPTSYLDTDGTLAANSDSKIATQKAVKTYADGLIAAADAMRYRGATDCSANPNYPAGNAGDTYRVSVAGKIGGASGVNVEVGDMFICLTDGTSAGNQATVGANWNIIQTNLDGAVIGPASATDNAIVRFDATTGKLVQNSGATIDDSGNLTANNLTGTNTGDQTSIVGITGTKAQFDTAVTDGNFLYVGDVTQYTDEMAQDAVGSMIDSTLNYVDGTPLLQRAALTGDVTASAGSNATTIASGAVTLAKQADVATSTVFYRKTAGTGAPEVQTLATLKTDLGLTGTNSGDQTITLTGAVTGSGTGSFATTIATPGTLTVSSTNSTATAHTHAITSSSAPGAAASILATDSSGIIGSTGTRIVKGWFTDLTVTNNIAGSITGNAATVTTNANLTGDVTSSGNATTIANDAVTYAKMQNVSATDKLLGRSTAGAGDVEEIDCTAAGRALIDDADASAQRTTLGLGTLATQNGTFSGTSSGTNTGDQNLFSTIAVSGQSNVVADTTSDTLTLVAGSNVTITTNATTDEITISAAGGSGSPGGSDTQIQYNNAGSFGGTAALTYATSGTHLTTTAQSATDKVLIVKGAASQTANLAEFQSSAGTAFITVGAPALAGDSATKNFLNVTGTMPTTMTATTHAVNYQITGAGSSSQSNTAFNINYLAGYTGSSQTRALQAINASAGTGATYAAGYFINTGNFAAQFQANPSTTGVNVGVRALASGSSVANYGVWVGNCSSTNTPALNVGMASFALSATTNCAGFFALADYGTSAPTFSNAALIADNGGTTGDIAVFRDNGTAKVTIADGGNVTCTGNVSVADEAYGVSWNGSTNVPTKNAVYDKIETLGGLTIGKALALIQQSTSYA